MYRSILLAGTAFLGLAGALFLQRFDASLDAAVNKVAADNADNQETIEIISRSIDAVEELEP